MQSAVKGDSDFSLRIHAPQQALQDTLDALDAIVLLEEANRRMVEEEFVNRRQDSLMAMKLRVGTLVQTIMEALIQEIPNPVKAAVDNELQPALKRMGLA